MSLTFGQAKQVIAKYEGRGGKLPSATSLNLFTIKVLQYLLYTGSPNKERIFELYAFNGMFTAPHELEVPLKARINGKVANVVDKWFEFRSGTDLEGECVLGERIVEDPNSYYTAYDLPSCGAQVGIRGTANEECDANIIVQGTDTSGREIFTNHKGAKIAGELLEIRNNTLVWSNVIFGKITGILKTKTKGYTPLYWKTSDTVKGFLADYSPIDEVPTYRRYKLLSAQCPSPAKIEVLGRLRIKDAYSDNDKIPFDNLLALEVAAQQVQALGNKQIDNALKGDGFLKDLVTRESAHVKQNTGTPLEFFYANSAGTIKGLF